VNHYFFEIIQRLDVLVFFAAAAGSNAPAAQLSDTPTVGG
jgi:hypothetical protein